MNSIDKYMDMAISQAYDGIGNKHGGPFGAVIVKDGEVVGVGHNEVLKQNDPTCHGEVMAIRDACKNLGTFDLSGCILYTTAYPCKMCLGAIQWANIETVKYGCNVNDTDSIGFRDKTFYENDGIKFVECDRNLCLNLFNEYNLGNHKKY